MKELTILCSILVLTSCATPWKRPGSSESHILKGVSPVAGGHCESSAILNALRYEGYDAREWMITGGGGALSFIFLKGDFPFIGARNDDMRARFFDAARIVGHTAIPSGPDADWGKIDSLLARGIPVVLRVDMRFLRYRYGGRYGAAFTSFGGHYVTLFGIDRERDVAIVSDTEFGSLQTVPLADLHKARTSNTKAFPPKGEYCWIEPPEAARTGDGLVALDADRLLRASLKTVAANYEGGSLSGLERYGADLASLEDYSKNKFVLPMVFDYMAGNIEDYGTGGASFRILYRDFIAYAAEKGSRPEVASLLPLLDDAIASWHELSAEFRGAAKSIRALKGAEREALYARLGDIANRLYERELKVYTEVKRLNGGD